MKKYFNYLNRFFLLTTIVLINSIFFTKSRFFQGIVIEQLNNFESVQGTTYRLYAQMSEGNLYIITADESNPSLLSTSTTFYENTDGGNFQSDTDPDDFESNPNLEWDSWLTIGDSYSSALSTIGELNYRVFFKKIWSWFGNN